jgi:hypothetical protein
MSVWAYTTAAFVELFLNGASLGKQSVPPLGRPWGWNISWVPGNVTAVGYAPDGETVVATAFVATVGEPVSVRLTLETPASLTADGWDTALVTAAVVDAAGAVVPTAMNELFFDVDAGEEVSHAPLRYAEFQCVAIPAPIPILILMHCAAHNPTLQARLGSLRVSTTATRSLTRPMPAASTRSGWALRASGYGLGETPGRSCSAFPRQASRGRS